MSKLQRTEATLHLPAHQPATEEMNHPQKVPSDSQTPAPQEEKSQSTGSRHPLGHKVKQLVDILVNCRKNKFLPMGDSVYGSDVWYQPREVVSVEEKGGLLVSFEEFINGDEVCHFNQNYLIYPDDLLKMIYLCERADNVYYNIESDSFDLWLVHKCSDLMSVDKTLDMNDHGKIAKLLLEKKKENTFVIGRGSFMECYFQKRCKHKYQGCDEKFANPNVVACKALKGKFEYVIELRLFLTSPEIHERKLGDMFEESQAV